MTPVGAVCLGFVLVVLDLRMPTFDVLADPLGWVFVVVGLARLTRLDVRFLRACTLAVLAGFLSLADVVHPTATTVTSSGTTTSAVSPGGVQGLLVTGYELVDLAATVLLCLALRARAREYGEERLAQRFLRLAQLNLVLGAGALVATVAVWLGAPTEPSSDVARGLVLLAVLAALAVGLWFLVTLAGCRHRPWLQDVRRDPVGDPS